ncbi:MAG: choice-of-anchor L domain-containing protein [Polyangiaceae bacterium]|nr:choice-of-anchor L domain-containing protein [Polyangiaceae bacterium]
MIRVPTNARSLRFNFRFFSCEYPVYICDAYNDVFAVIMTPSPLDPGDTMYDSDTNSANIAFDATKGVIGVNNKDFLTACEPSNAYDLTSPTEPEQTNIPNGYNNCKAGSGKLLQGSGFEGHAASAWLATQVPVPSPSGKQASIIYLRFAIWDSGDHLLDSTALIDNFRWSAEEGSNQPVTIIDPPIIQ